MEGDDDPQKDRDDKLQHLFYADESQIYLRVSIDQLEYGIATLSRVADGVLEWSERVALKLNSLKTKSIICGSRDFINRIPVWDGRFHSIPYENRFIEDRNRLI